MPVLISSLSVKWILAIYITIFLIFKAKFPKEILSFVTFYIPTTIYTRFELERYLTSAAWTINTIVWKLQMFQFSPFMQNGPCGQTHFKTIATFAARFLKCLTILGCYALTFSWRRLLSYRNQSIDLFCKSMDWIETSVMKELKGSKIIDLLLIGVCLGTFACNSIVSCLKRAQVWTNMKPHFHLTFNQNMPYNTPVSASANPIGFSLVGNQPKCWK